MMRSLFAGVSGLRNHQIRMDVVANKIIISRCKCNEGKSNKNGCYR